MTAKPEKVKQPKILGVAEVTNTMQTLDSFQNVLARTGYGTPNLMEATSYPLTRLTKNYNLMNSLYRNSWVARRIIDTIPKDMVKNWIKFESDLSPESITEIEKNIKATRLKASILKGLCWGRLYGGAAGLMMIEGQEDYLEEPLDIETVMPGDFKGLLIADRWSGVSSDTTLVTDISNAEFGLPEYYQFTDNAKRATFRVHHSRIVRFIGDDLPEWEKQAESYWGASIIESVYEELKKRDNTSANIAGLVFLANLRILKMADLGELLSGTVNQKGQQDLASVLQAQNYLQSNFGLYVMSKDDEFQSIRTSFDGLDAIYECFMMDLAGATQIPVTKLFGRSPGGMNATGESDTRNYCDVIEQEQESRLLPVLEKLLPVIAMSSIGEVAEDLTVIFNPIETPSEKEAGENIRWKTDAIMQYHDRGIISDQIALKEAKQMAEGTGLFSNVTDEDIAKAATEPKQMDLMGDPDAEGDDNIPPDDDGEGDDKSPKDGDVDS